MANEKNGSIKGKVAEKVIEKVTEKLVEKAEEEIQKGLEAQGTQVTTKLACETRNEEEIEAEDTQNEFEFEWDAEDITRAERDLKDETKQNVDKALDKKIASYKIDWRCKDDCVPFIETSKRSYKFGDPQWSTGTGGIGKWMTIKATGTVKVFKGCKKAAS